MEMIDYRALQPQLYEAMHGVQEEIDASGLDSQLLEIVKLRASQINGCAFCVNLHTTSARDAGVDDQRLHMVSAWMHANSFTARERTALRWCEEVTRLSDAAPSADAVAELQRHFNDEQIVALTWAVAVINAWNRVAVSLGRRGGPPAPVPA
jgi:AhpD family alkylhydroperoxidase